MTMATGTTGSWAGNPYGKYLEGQDPLVSLREGPARVRAIIGRMTPAQLAKSYGPGKWTATQIVVHLAQCEMVYGARVRRALTQDQFAFQPFGQDAWVARESGLDVLTALRAYEGMRAMNAALYASLTGDERARIIAHPSRGEMQVGWIVEMLAGHERNHEAQLQTIAEL
jgi:hypothetical protein